MEYPHPQRLLVSVKKPIAEFYHMAGNAIFAKWDEVSNLRTSKTREAETPKSLVASQIITSLANGGIKASIGIALDIDFESDEADWAGSSVMIGGLYWHNNRDRFLDWSTSTADVPMFYLHLVRSDGETIRFEDFRKVSDNTKLFSKCFVSIEDAHSAVSRMFDLGPLPQQAWFERYNSFSNRLFDELAIVGWRYLAMKTPRKDAPLNKVLVELFREYATKTGGLNTETAKGLSERSLSNFATEILKQWKRDNTLEFALLNSSPARKYEGSNIIVNAKKPI